jgi:carboxypeptidase family protein
VDLKLVFADRQFVTALAAAVLLASFCDAKAADLAWPVTGELVGTVTDSAGIPQMGASVQVFNKYQRFVARGITDINGRFAFAALAADTYSVRVSLASFLPAARDKVFVKPGFDSVLRIHLATLLSNIEVSYRVPNSGMSDEWRWVLRSSPAMRPINRFVSVDLPEPKAKLHPHVFSGTHAMLSVSGGDSGLIDSDDVAGDMGTSFAVSTNVFGNNQLRVAGSLGQTSEFAPSAMALAAIYSRTDDSPFAAPPQITLSVLQWGGIVSQLAGGGPNGAGGATAGPPVLRAMSLGIYQVADPLDNVHVEYGATGESVEYGQHTTRVSPFGRVTVNVGSGTAIVASYNDGARPDELLAHQEYRESELDGGLNDLGGALQAISRLPQVSDRNGRLELERTESYELGVKKTAGSRTFAASSFYETVSNGRLNVAGDVSGLNSGDLFSDGISTTSIYNMGRYRRMGYLASANQRVSSALDVGLAYGRLGGFMANSSGVSDLPWDASRFLAAKQSNLASLSVTATVPRAGTRISTDYGWIDRQTLVPLHVFTTQTVAALPGFNVLLRQPLPSFGMPGHLELTADVRNLLADGYTPINTPGGHRMLVVESPRAIRGGLKFTF